MKKEDYLIEIAGKEFVTDRKAQQIIESYQKELRKKYRININIRNELLKALRDVLIATQKKPTQIITEKVATDAVAMTGDSYEHQGNLDPIKNGIKIGSIKLSSFTKKYVLKESVRRKIFLCLAFIILFPLGLLISSLPVFDPYQTTEPNFQGVFESTLGNVKQGDYAQGYSIPQTGNRPEDILPDYNAKQTYLLILVTLLLSLLFYLLSKRSKFVEINVALLIIASICSFTVSDNMNHFLEYEFSARQMNIYEAANNYDRDVDDYDTLFACGAEINYILGGDNDGMFYALRDKGFILNEELPTATNTEFPTREKLCDTYNSLRKNYSNDKIVLQSYIKDSDGSTHPIDWVKQTEDIIKNKQEKVRFGFFVVQ